MNDYTTLLAFMRGRVEEGDIAEIGAFVGKGTRQLCEAFPRKIIYAVDVFDIHFDETVNASDIPMTQFYADELNGRDQLEVFVENTRNLENLVVVQSESAKFIAPTPLWLTVIDGGHSPAIVRKDFKNAHGSRYIVFHDYKHDLPQLTKTIDALTKDMERYEIGSTFLVCKPAVD